MTQSELPTPQSSALAELAARGFIEQVSDFEAIDRDLAAKPVCFYIGYDPTAPSLHVGNLVTMMAMRRMQKHGHRPIVLLGGGTVRVGDPSGKNEMRKLLDDAALDANVQAIARQFAPFIDFTPTRPNAAIALDNAAWLMDLHYVEFLRDIGVHFTVNRMIATKTYRDRLDAELPLSFLEFNYQLLQAYDFLHLYRTHDCTMQLGGGDQWGNMIAGVELIRRMASVEDADGARIKRLGPPHCLTSPLLTTADGRKMGKTEKGAVWLDADLVPPFDYYQYWISVDDRDVKRLLLTFTDLEVAEIEELCRDAQGADLRAVKAKLAFEATKIAHGEEEANRAQVATAQAFGDSEDWSAVPAVELAVAEVALLDLVVDDRIGAFKSKREARQRIEGGAIRVNGEVVKDTNLILRADAFEARTLRLQAGKKIRFRVVLGAG